jgi:hypothetical protein
MNLEALQALYERAKKLERQWLAAPDHIDGLAYEVFDRARDVFASELLEDDGVCSWPALKSEIERLRAQVARLEDDVRRLATPNEEPTL